MATEQINSDHYFDTPARAERLQLLLHLVRNAGEVIYLRAPAGAGKTRFAQRLLDALGDHTATVWVRASQDCDVAAVAVDQLGLTPEEISPWPDAVMAGLSGQDLLVIVDDADRLGLEAVESLAVLHARGGRLLLVGQGGLAQTSGNWDLQFVDLPAFEADQTVAFLRSMSGAQAGRVTDDLAAGLHRASNGLPGPLLDALKGVLGKRETQPGARPVVANVPERPRQPAWYWLASGALIFLLAAGLLFEEQINSVFEPDQVLTDRPAPVVVEAVEPTSPIKRSPMDILPAAEAPREKAVSDLMPEALTGSGNAPDESVKASVHPKVAPEPVAAATSPDQATGTPDEVQPDAGSDKEDPLDAVMRDALAAADAGEAPDPSANRPVVVADHLPDNKVSPDSATPMEPAPPEVAPPVVEKIAAVPASTIADSGQKAVSAAPEPKVAAVVPAPVESRDARQGAAVVGAEPVVVTPAAVETTPEAAASDADDSGQAGVVEQKTQRQAVVPAPVESREAPDKPGVVRPQPAAVVSQTAPRHASDWLKSRAPGRFTLQLVGARDRNAVEKFVRDHAIEEPYAIFARDLKGKPWYSLVAGDYPDRDAAIAARGRLPSGLERSGVWPRTFDSIQKAK
jgi:septal ring-binding cell division protein DamX